MKLSRVMKLAFALLVSSSAFGQTPKSPKDSVAPDSATVDSIRMDSTRQVKDAYGLEAAFYALAIAPAGLAAIIPKDSAQHPVYSGSGAIMRRSTSPEASRRVVTARSWVLRGRDREASKHFGAASCWKCAWSNSSFSNTSSIAPCALGECFTQMPAWSGA